MKNIFKIALVALFGLSLSSCLKDKDFDDKKVGLDLSDVPKIIELGNASVSASSQTLGLIFVNAVIDVKFVTVRLAAADPATEDLRVSLDTSGSATFIDTTYAGAVVNLPNSLFTYPNGLTVTIPKGSREGYLMIKTNASNFDPSKTYGLSFKIGNIANSGYTASGNFNRYTTLIGAKNIYDGTYRVLSGLVTRYTSPGTPAGDALSGPVGGNPNITLKTINSTTCEIGNLRWSGGTSSVAGIDNLRVSVDPVTNLATMSSLGNATLTNWAGKINDFDPATGTFRIAFRWNPTANVREYEMVIRKL